MTIKTTLDVAKYPQRAHYPLQRTTGLGKEAIDKSSLLKLRFLTREHSVDLIK